MRFNNLRFSVKRNCDDSHRKESVCVKRTECGKGTICRQETTHASATGAKPHKLHSVNSAPPVDRVLPSKAACVVAAPIRHNAYRLTAAARAYEVAALGDRREWRSVFDAGRRERHKSGVKARGVRARHAESACAHGFQAGDCRGYGLRGYGDSAFISI
jgi:hypothetical protein